MEVPAKFTTPEAWGPERPVQPHGAGGLCICRHGGLQPGPGSASAVGAEV